MKRFGIPLLIALLFVAGVSIVVYPIVSNLLYEKDQSQVLTQYNETVENTKQEELDAQWQAAQAYNESLLESEAFLTDPFNPELALDPTVEPYASLLNLEGDGIMGYLEIPAISLNLPVYHGTTADVLEKGVGHLQNSSLPVGGESTHTVLTGHTGLAGKRLFTDLSQVEVGDVFYLYILGRTLAYEVEAINIVEPDQTELLVVTPGQDQATLVTCYPYGINTHRLLVQGTRVPYEEAVEQQQTGQPDRQTRSVWESEYQKAVLLCLAVYLPLTAVVVILLLRRRSRKAASAVPTTPAAPPDPMDSYRRPRRIRRGDKTE